MESFCEYHWCEYHWPTWEEHSCRPSHIAKGFLAVITIIVEARQAQMDATQQARLQQMASICIPLYIFHSRSKTLGTRQAETYTTERRDSRSDTETLGTRQAETDRDAWNKTNIQTDTPTTNGCFQPNLR